jgi:predicted nucleic acid-binding protein
MTAKVFVDSNILVYAHDADAGLRQQQASDLLKTLWDNGYGRLSTQVLQEFFVNVTQKIKRPIARGVAREVIRSYGLWVESVITPSTVIRASEISEAWMLSFWDSMIFAAAEQDGAQQLFTVDMNSGQIIAGIQVVNPFR